jgi:hypothetical protein
MNAIFDAGRKFQVPPSLVADKIVEIVQSKTWKLRHPTGPDAEPFLQYRASISDEEWVNLHGDRERSGICRENQAGFRARAGPVGLFFCEMTEISKTVDGGGVLWSAGRRLGC